ncbi:tail fiber protein [Flavivirga eckloniae]|uniref:Peptidase S74 domain-containing protein n=1 Tax=Flavivirga eckloniae TaxID=1803846 RepID=A0A2K9PLK0_9FLAO|nr:tail fiber protein [Flavivirga eckloniae]AUP77941.1 hypothetical protein C1H87_04125 [Flavivirga eckloniae]
MKKAFLSIIFIFSIFITIQSQNPSTFTVEKTDNTSTSLNLKNPTGFWHLSGPRSYEANNNFSIFWHDGIYKRYFTILDNGNIGIGVANPNSKLHVFGQVDGNFNGLVIDNRKNYGANSGTNETSRILLSLTEDDTPNPLNRIFGIIEAGTISETDSSNGRLSFHVRQNGASEEKMRINHKGDIGIGTTNPDMKLTVKGKIHAEEVKIDLSVPAPDYVFKENYNLRSIEEVERFIIENSHLPEIPSAKEFEQNGVMQAEMDMNLLKKIEELTLYTIAQEKKIKELEALNQKLIELQLRVDKLESKK